MSAVDKITSARTALVLDAPFFASLILNMKMVSDPSQPTAWVDGRSIGFNPSFVDGLNHDQTVGLLAHEVMHPALGHTFRRDGRDPRKWNIACDKVINPILRDSGFILPPDAYYAEGDEVGKSAEWIYGKMLQDESKPEPEPGEQEEDEEGEQDSEPGDEPGDEGDEEGEGDGDEPGEDGDGTGESDQPGEDGESDGDGTGDGPGKPNPLGEVRDAPTTADEDGTEAPTEQEWKERTAAAALNAASQGKLPGGMKRLVEQALKPKFDPRALLLRFFSERTTGDFSWTLPNVRYIPQGLYLPALYTETLGHVAIVNDTSGSRGNIAMAAARHIVEQVIEEVNPVTVTVYHADADVHRVDRMEQGEPLTWDVDGGGGGTDFRPALQAIEDEGTAVCAIYITDLFGTFPDVPPSFPVLWLSTTEDLEAPFGETVFVEG